MNPYLTEPTQPGPEKVFVAGTHRVRHPNQTWELIRPKAAKYGVTRIADVTGLDSLGIPVAMSVRPLARTLSVSQGKGQTYELARVSALMEAIELWHAEKVTLPPAHQKASGRSLGLPYRIGSLAAPGSLIDDDTPMDWLMTSATVSRTDVPIPRDLVLTPPFDKPWTPFGFTWSSNGLASGNTVHEAALHALYEVVERDAACAPNRREPRPIDPSSVQDDNCSTLIERIQDKAQMELHLLPNRLDIPVFSAGIWSRDFPVVCRGWGAHSDHRVALSRAITEAAQSRLTAIAGSRDDLPQVYEHVRSGADRVDPTPAPLSSLPDSMNGPASAFSNVVDEFHWLCARITAIIGTEPLMVDLSTDHYFSVVKVVVPGTYFDIDVIHPRGQ